MHKSGHKKIVSEYNQEIPQSQTADNPVASQGRAAQPSRGTRKTNLAKQPALFPFKMIAILERTQSNVQQNINLHFMSLTIPIKCS